MLAESRLKRKCFFYNSSAHAKKNSQKSIACQKHGKPGQLVREIQGTKKNLPIII